MQIAIVHDWLNGMRGGEKVLEALLELWPHARLFTLFHEPGKVSPLIESKPIVVSPLGRLPGIQSRYRDLLPLFPWAIEAMDLGSPDLVFSSSHAVAKGARTRGALHICYCHTPMRYIWDAREDYAPNLVRRTGLRVFGPRLRKWDRQSSGRVHHFLANSQLVADRIRNYYDRSATVIYPPVDTAFFSPPRQESEFFLSVGALVGYKRVDLAVDACTQTSRRLVVVGEGPEKKKLMRRAGSTVLFRGWVSPEELRSLYRSATALIVAAREDFGIAAVEARCCGCPLVAFSKSGVAETLQDGITAVLFDEQTVPALRAAMDRVEHLEWDPHLVQKDTGIFSSERFRSEIDQFVRTHQ